jgi:hypothetical protein
MVRIVSLEVLVDLEVVEEVLAQELAALPDLEVLVEQV